MFAPPMPSWWPWLLRLRLLVSRLTGVMCAGVAARSLVGGWTAFGVGCGLGLTALVVLVVVRGPGRVDALVAWALREGRPPPGVPPALVDAEASRRRPSWWSACWGPAFLVLSLVVLAVLVAARGSEAPPLAVVVFLGLACVGNGGADWLSVREARRWRARTATAAPGVGLRRGPPRVGRQG